MPRRGDRTSRGRTRRRGGCGGKADKTQRARREREADGGAGWGASQSGGPPHASVGRAGGEGVCRAAGASCARGLQLWGRTPARRGPSANAGGGGRHAASRAAAITSRLWAREPARAASDGRWPGLIPLKMGGANVGAPHFRCNASAGRAWRPSRRPTARCRWEGWRRPPRHTTRGGGGGGRELSLRAHVVSSSSVHVDHSPSTRGQSSCLWAPPRTPLPSSCAEDHPRSGGMVWAAARPALCRRCGSEQRRGRPAVVVPAHIGPEPETSNTEPTELDPLS